MRGQAVKDAPAGKTIKITGTIQAASASGNNGELEITKDLTIKPNGSSATLDANNMSRIFKVTGGNFKLYNMVLQSGNAGENEGGGIYVSGDELVLSETTIKNYIAQDGGGIYLAGNGTKGSMFKSKILNNKAQKTDGTAKGGGIFAGTNNTLTVSGTAAIKKNSAKGFGGGVYSSGTFIFTGGTIEGNNITLSSKLGTGIFIESTNNELTISGTAHVKNDNDIYLVNNAKITVQGFSTKEKYSKVTLWWKGYYLNK